MGYGGRLCDGRCDPSRVLRSARRTIADGIRFYERQEAGLGAYFLSATMSDLRSLRIYAGSHQLYADTPYYRMVCKRFPYSIYYLVNNRDVAVYAVLDDRRDPSWIGRRLEGLDLDE